MLLFLKKPFSASCWHHIKALRTRGLFLAPCRLLAAPGASSAPVGSSSSRVVPELGRFGEAGTEPSSSQSAPSPQNTSANKGAKLTTKCLRARASQKPQRGNFPPVSVSVSEPKAGLNTEQGVTESWSGLG